MNEMCHHNKNDLIGCYMQDDDDMARQFVI